MSTDFGKLHHPYIHITQQLKSFDVQEQFAQLHHVL